MYYRVRKTWQDRDSQIGAFTLLRNAEIQADLNPGYSVFDEAGPQLYPIPSPVPERMGADEPAGKEVEPDAEGKEVADAIT